MRPSGRRERSAERRGDQQKHQSSIVSPGHGKSSQAGGARALKPRPAGSRNEMNCGSVGAIVRWDYAGRRLAELLHRHSN
jgi:hypothetical protein